MTHWYSPEGVLQPEGVGFPSATTILAVRHNQGLQDWRDRMGAQAADEYKMERAGIGTLVHAACEEYLLTGEVRNQLEEGAAHMFQGFLNWLEKQELTDVLTEQFVYSQLHEYAGTADLICTINGEQWIVDYKTSKHIDPSYGLQLAAYAQAWEEMGRGTSRRAVLQLTDQTKKAWRWKEFTDDNDFGVFMAHKEVFDWLQKVHPPRQTPQWKSGILSVG
jgi:predicted RecB family nuclease